MKFIVNLAKEVFNSGKAIGLKTNITEATGWLKAHSKGIGEEIGNALNGNAKRVNDKLIKEDIYDKVFTHIDDVAKQYPDATVQVAAKNAKKGGYKIVKIDVKNGEKTIYKQAVSVTDDGAIKTRANSMGAEMSEYSDSKSIRTKSKSNVGTVQTSFNLAEQTGEIELNHAGKLVASANYVNKGGNITRGGVTYEVADNLLSGQMYYNGHEVYFLGDTKGLKDWGTRYKTEIKRQKEEAMPLVIELLRPLRDRFNTAIDLFKYNGKTNFERFVSKDELYKSIKELQGEVISFEKLKQAKELPIKDMQYLRQIKTDITQAKKLIEVTV